RELEGREGGRPVPRGGDRLVVGLQRVADERRRHEARGLLEEGDDRVLDQRRQRGGADGGERREQQAVGQPAAEPGLLRVLVVVVDGMRVAGHSGEEHEVRVGQRPGWAAETIADAEVFEEELLHQLSQNNACTASAASAWKSAVLRRALPVRPAEYQARCFLSWTRASRGGRCASIKAQWRRMMRARMSRSTGSPAKIHGAPSAPRPLITAPQPVAATRSRASACLRTSPLPVTATPTA